MDAHSITLEADPNEAEVRAVINGLVQFNASCAESENWQHLVILLRDSAGVLQGGVLGHTHWQWLYISHLWIAESSRSQGYGRLLLTRAEEEALRRGCGHAHLDTFDFQARGFYEKLGYAVFGQLPDFPTGHTRYFLQKVLGPCANRVP
jgi:GNAT superfamily N-acetyltransferase